MYADTLVRVLRGQLSSDSSRGHVLEAQAYSSMLSGSLFFEKTKWHACIKSFSITRVIYSAFTTSTRNEVFRELLSSTVDPSIRYAAYQCNLPRTKAVSDLAIENISREDSQLRPEIEAVDPQAFQSTTTKQRVQDTNAPNSRSIPSTITWRSRTVKIEDANIAQSLALAISKEEHLIKRYHDSPNMDQKLLIGLYEEVITARQETVDATKTAVEETTAEGIEVSDPKMQSLQITKTAVSYALIEWQVGRNRILCGTNDGVNSQSHLDRPESTGVKNVDAKRSKPESTGKKLSKLRQLLLQYDSSLQSLDNVKQLPGVAGDGALLTDLNTARNYFQSLKYVVERRTDDLRC